MSVTTPIGQVKTEHPPLLEAGIKYMSLDMLHHLAVEPFPSSQRRPMLYENLEAWTAKAVELQIKGEIWIDGSFVTHKIEPDDIDCAVIIHSLPEATEKSLREIGQHIDKQLIRTSHNLDIYPLLREDPDTQRLWIPYWRGWFGYERDGVTAKGIARIEI